MNEVDRKKVEQAFIEQGLVPVYNMLDPIFKELMWMAFVYGYISAIEQNK